ncbi:hypothetical protein INS49_014631 [Diaporthe citri]|uniref:uncharacterized protein n=1 Tax=Diaporthe citri TaxID=83186 RepID=UPI001C800021|nr:uncharacterized protein INS49_014631 [Diaporthe citri]KAG6356757.1 hypothetical protein INS49_014631 [Diaporthe citri]
MFSTTYPSLAGPGPGDHAGPSIPLEDLDPKVNPAEGDDSLDLGAGSTGDKGKRAIPLDDLRKAVKGIENLQAGSPSKLHDFVATDNGIVGSAMAALPDTFQLDRSSALKVMDKSEAIEGLFCPCITYGKIRHELDKAQMDRVEFGGGIFATKQTKAISLFYNLAAHEGNKALNVVAHNATNLRNLAEVRIREELRKRLHQDTMQKAQQYVSELPMEMKKMLPDQLPQLDLPLPEQLTQPDLPQVLEDALQDGKPRAVSLVDRFRDLLTRKASEQAEKAPEPGLLTTISPSQNLSTDVAPESKEDEEKLSSLAVGEKKNTNKDEQPKKPKTKLGSRLKKSQKGKGKQVDRENEPPVPVGPQPEDEADKVTQEADGAQEAIPAVRLERGQSIVEIPANARVHSLSEDTFLIEKPSHLPHDLDLDNIVPLDKARLSHILEHDQMIQLKPAPEEHRLSADSMIPTTAPAPGHFLEGDPVVSGPRQILSHELLDDPIVKRAKAFLPHTLESDKKVAVAKAARAHSLANDTILPPPPTPAAHDLDSDKIIAALVPAGQEHDISRDVRILSPSGQVRATHIIDADEIIRETAHFRKSPRPDPATMPGNWASSSASEGGAENNNNNNLVASLNAVVNSADRAPEELGHEQPAESGKENKAAGLDAPPARGFWGRMFPKRQAPAAVATPDATAPPGDQPAAPEAEGNTEGQAQG